MGGQEVFINQNPVIDSDDKVGSASITHGAGEIPLVYEDGLDYFRTRTGRRARLVFTGNAVDAGGESVITFHVYANGVRLPPPHASFQQALGATYDPQSRLAVPVNIPQNAYVQVKAENSHATDDFTAYVRVRLEYEAY
jgi:hypothetical protein